MRQSSTYLRTTHIAMDTHVAWQNLVRATDLGIMQVALRIRVSSGAQRVPCWIDTTWPGAHLRTRHSPSGCGNNQELHEMSVGIELRRDLQDISFKYSKEFLFIGEGQL